MRKIKPATLRDVMNVQRGIELLKEARDLFKKAGADNTTDKVRAAIISAGGAERHVSHRYRRTTVDV